VLVFHGSQHFSSRALSWRRAALTLATEHARNASERAQLEKKLREVESGST
jgi:hypothetical protein